VTPDHLTVGERKTGSTILAPPASLRDFGKLHRVETIGRAAQVSEELLKCRSGESSLNQIDNSSAS